METVRFEDISRVIEIFKKYGDPVTGYAHRSTVAITERLRKNKVITP